MPPLHPIELEEAECKQDDGADRPLHADEAPHLILANRSSTKPFTRNCHVEAELREEYKLERERCDRLVEAARARAQQQSANTATTTATATAADEEDDDEAATGTAAEAGSSNGKASI